VMEFGEVYVCKESEPSIIALLYSYSIYIYIYIYIMNEDIILDTYFVCCTNCIVMYFDPGVVVVV
jgi:hypothetical protein